MNTGGKPQIWDLESVKTDIGSNGALGSRTRLARVPNCVVSSQGQHLCYWRRNIDPRLLQRGPLKDSFGMVVLACYVSSAVSFQVEWATAVMCI